MDDKIALNGFKNLLNDIDKDNHLFVGTINPEMIKIAISAIESKLAEKKSQESEVENG